MSKIHALPLELLQNIFSFCLPTSKYKMFPKEAPLLLTHICRRWREVAFSTPQFWTHLHVFARFGTDDNLTKKDLISRYGEAIKVWLNRASGLPLSISFVTADSEECHEFERDDRLGSDPHILGIIASFSRTWFHLNLKVKYQQLTHFSHLTENDVPLLKTIEIESFGTRWPARKQPLPFLSAPSLKSVFFWNNWLLSELHPLPIRWGTLTTLSILSWHDMVTSLDLDMAVTLLSQCSNLVVCSLRIMSRLKYSSAWSDSAEPQFHPPPLQLYHLEELRVYPEHGPTSFLEHWTTFFEALQVPEIRHLEVTGCHDKVPQLPFMPIILRPHKIETMTLVAHGSKEDLIECLRATPLLRRLALSSQTCHHEFWTDDVANPSMDESLLHYLTASAPFDDEPQSDTLTLCPFLEEIEFIFPLNLAISVERIMPFLLSRTTLAPADVSRLRRAHLYLPLVESQDSVHDVLNSCTELGTALQAGLDLYMFYYPETKPKHCPQSSAVFPAERDFTISQPHDDWKPRSEIPHLRRW
ncbi:hypothetical protein H0H81_008857 [Sphagnurus paluster]|uniref:F-box domain-containing protein n=1 Tax=Sphagnurus paluster TaxID=117069 RepID=A0A9P7KL98_9AGAR|nr:hypothetical protein H0H81_008857 [Sphagnurus paluster]